MQLLQIFQKGYSGILVLLADDFAQRKKRLCEKETDEDLTRGDLMEAYLFAIMGCQYREGRHSIDRQGRGYICRQRLRKEGNSSFGLAAGWEELTALLVLSDKEGRRAKAPATPNPGINLMVQQPLNMID